ncbi:DUF86 domain-containing protein [Rhodococcus sp. WB9]|uniref:HepT-like ribonuclease domain-containing protein n=1 Tax=Rhodococcus sp. WB9 TaxID=2594007 RepID=UPI0011849C56|nr:HepT-like ribonuclease domain-containing protein [Rhodococcus sp. WB9]QDQ94777.1 DUF86 domain-containing protein [Rhodococcus sp. WB9]
MSRADRDRLEDILGAIGAVMRYYPKLSGDDRDMAYDAIVRQLEVIGEAANRLDPETKAEAPEIEWHKISGFRNLAIHEYFRVNQSIVEGIVSNYLPHLREAVERIRDRLDN